MSPCVAAERRKGAREQATKFTPIEAELFDQRARIDIRAGAKLCRGGEQVIVTAGEQRTSEQTERRSLLARVAKRKGISAPADLDVDSRQLRERALQFDPPQAGRAVQESGRRENREGRGMSLEHRKRFDQGVAVTVIEGQSEKGLRVRHPEQGRDFVQGYKPISFFPHVRQQRLQKGWRDLQEGIGRKTSFTCSRTRWNVRMAPRPRVQGRARRWSPVAPKAARPAPITLCLRVAMGRLVGSPQSTQSRVDDLLLEGWRDPGDRHFPYRARPWSSS